MLSLRGLGSRDFSDMFDLTRQLSKQMPETPSLKLDVRENKDNYEAVFDVPGAPKDAVKISHEDQTLTVSVDHKEERSGKEKDGKVHWRERSSGFVSRSITMPDNCDFEKATAKQENGVLTITFPKTKAAEKKKYINIQ